jgi:hypothetical protein
MKGKENTIHPVDPILTTKVHGYQQIIVSNLLKDRHPYIDKNFLASQFASRKSNQLGEDVRETRQPEVFKGVWFRTVGNLVTIISDKSSSPLTLQEALLVLNEMVTVQEHKVLMIEAGLVEIAFDVLNCDAIKVRIECLSLLGSLLSIREGRKRLNNVDMKILRQLLTDDQLAVREAACWMLVRIASARDGVQSLINKNLVKPIVSSFMKYFNNNLESRDSLFLVLMLETLTDILDDEDSHTFFQNCSIMQLFASILRQFQTDPTKIGPRSETTVSLCFECISLLSISNEFKAEIVNANMMDIISTYLASGSLPVQIYCLRILMFVAINAQGKSQIIDFKDHCILKAVKDLSRSENKDIQENCAELVLSLVEDVKRFKPIYDSL